MRSLRCRLAGSQPQRAAHQPIDEEHVDAEKRQSTDAGQTGSGEDRPPLQRDPALDLPGLLVGLGAVAAAEFSFLLGLVTLTAASGYSVLKVAKADGGAQFVAALGGWLPIACGIAVAWASAALSIDLLVRYLQRHTLALFGWWRLLVAALVGVFAWRYGLTLPA